jgi:hypothetical protein
MKWLGQLEKTESGDLGIERRLLLACEDLNNIRFPRNSFHTFVVNEL